MRRYLETLTDDRLELPLRYTNTRGQAIELPLWTILIHVINHGTQSRAEAGIALAGMGQSPGDLDFSLFLRQKAGDQNRVPLPAVLYVHQRQSAFNIPPPAWIHLPAIH